MAQNIQQLIDSLRTHRINTITELRRVEKTFAQCNTVNSAEAMANAWIYYVNSNNLLSELRSLTRNFPFSSECLDEAKALVIADPQSARSRNYCWLVLFQMQERQLIPKHARQIAAKPAMWGGKKPSIRDIEQLSNACIAEWTMALRQMLRHWEQPPTALAR
ncbi:hypothetical protein FQN50_006386 [Emmonsiellopsis sp. PD_5]|nr:hypothetical protein FQN50_006386 [Emmonsiellopsis sp. PD_5]